MFTVTERHWLRLFAADHRLLASNEGYKLVVYLSWEGSVCVNCMAEEGIDPAEMNGKCRPSVLRG